MGYTPQTSRLCDVFACASDADCNKHGACKRDTGTCACAPGYSGELHPCTATSRLLEPKGGRALRNCTRMRTCRFALHSGMRAKKQDSEGFMRMQSTTQPPSLRLLRVVLTVQIAEAVVPSVQAPAARCLRGRAPAQSRCSATSPTAAPPAPSTPPAAAADQVMLPSLLALKMCTPERHCCPRACCLKSSVTSQALPCQQLCVTVPGCAVG